ncbi:hypothetical protein QCA50_013529 [Cerrena zonata]|uniref:DUF6532 domain-containing protein n=1 Tax=Cerrena zonata TaxID=2478898 RepID=A0AAW0FVB0_9APHY
MSPYGTRPANVDKHPGLVDLVVDGTRKRRTPEEMVQAKLAKVAQEISIQDNDAILQAKEAALLRRIAELEDQARSLEEQSVGPSAPPMTKARGAKTSKANGIIQPSTTSRKGKTKVRRADVPKVVVKEVEVVEKPTESVKGARKRKIDSTPTIVSNSVVSSKRVKPANPSGLLVSYQPPPCPPPNTAATSSVAASGPEETIVQYGGYIDSDDDDNNSSDLPDHPLFTDRVTAQGTVKIEKDVAVDIAQVATTILASTKAASRGTKFTMKDIDALFPPHLRYLWREKYIPEVLFYVGARLEPWNLSGINWNDFLHSLWEEIMPHVREWGVPSTHPQSAVAMIVMQRICEWRNGINKFALEVLADLFQSEDMTEAEISQYVSSQIGKGLPFISVKTTFDPASGLPIREGRFQGPLVLRAFSYHLKRTGKLAREFRDTPDGALALTTVAVERALRKYKTGKLSVLKNRKGHSIDDFSQRRWGDQTNEYMKSICDLTESEWTEILEGAERHLGTSAGKPGDDEDDDDDDNDFESDSERARI